jgi:sulfate adenylyltransferase
VWLTGLSGAGKSTVSAALTTVLEARGRRVTLLDADVVRMGLSRGLGFSKEDRDANVQRMAFVAGEVVRHGGIVICAAVSPYREARDLARTTVGPSKFVEVFVNTPLAVCEARDPKGLYRRARRGELTGLTGVDAPYESPLHPEIMLDDMALGPAQNVDLILSYLLSRGLVE